MVRAKLNTCSAMVRENRNSGVVVASIRKSPRKVRNDSFIRLYLLQWKGKLPHYGRSTSRICCKHTLTIYIYICTHKMSKEMQHWYLDFIARSLYMFRAFSIPIIRSSITVVDSHWYNIM
jgi:hypothetical protein